MQCNEYATDPRSRRRLRPPLGITTGGIRRHRSNTRAHRTLLHAVRYSTAAADHQNHANICFQYRTSPAMTEP
jgi:hypothetical protein